MSDQFLAGECKFYAARRQDKLERYLKEEASRMLYCPAPMPAAPVVKDIQEAFIVRFTIQF